MCLIVLRVSSGFLLLSSSVLPKQPQSERDYHPASSSPDSGGDMAKVNNDYRVWLVGQVYDCGVHNDARTVWKHEALLMI